MTQSQIETELPIIDNSRVTLIYLDEAGNEHAQPLGDLAQAGTLVDPESGEDMILIGARVMSLAEIERQLWDKVAVALNKASAMHFEGCHKIYLSMDEGQVKVMKGNGYEIHKPDMELLREWFNNSCGLRFISAVHTTAGHPSEGFIELIPQGFLAADDEGTPSQIIINLTDAQRDVLEV